jgi:hypothetical protein
VEPPLADWRVAPLFGAPNSDDTMDDTMVVLTPKEAGLATVSFEYSWQGGTREFQTAIQVLAKDASAQ